MTSLSEVCEILYEKKGQSAVFEFVLNNFPEVEWLPCEPCEISSPMKDEACLVCGSKVTPRKVTVTYEITYEFSGDLLQEYYSQLDDYADTPNQREWFVIDRFIGHDNLRRFDRNAKLTVTEE
jgi:hypothetical protein